MQIRNTYNEVNPELLYAEMRDFILKQGVSLGEAKMETYTLPNETSSFVSRSTLTFNTSEGNQVCVRVHIVGSVKTETKMILDIDEKLFPEEKISAMLADVDFIFGLYKADS